MKFKSELARSAMSLAGSLRRQGFECINGVWFKAATNEIAVTFVENGRHNYRIV